MPNLFDRQEGEPDKAYQAFCHYRDLGPARSLRAVTQKIAENTARRQQCSAVLVLPDELAGESSSETRARTERRKKQHSGRVSEWSGKYNWVERARAWDDHLDKIALRRTISTVEKMAERHARQNEQVLGVLMVPFAEFAKSLQKDKDGKTLRNDLERLRASELLQLAIEAAKRFPALQEAERNARGVKVLTVDDPDSGTTGPAEWHVQIYQPEAKPNPDAVSNDTDEIPDQWEVAPSNKRIQREDDDDFED